MLLIIGIFTARTQKLSQSMKIPTVTINKRKLKDRRVSIYLSYRPQLQTQSPRKTTPLKHSVFIYGISLGTTSRRSLTSRQCCESRVSRLNESSPSSITNLTSSMPKREAETFYCSLVNSALADLPCTEFKFTTGNDLETSEVLLSVLFCIIVKNALFCCKNNNLNP